MKSCSEMCCFGYNMFSNEGPSGLEMLNSRQEDHGQWNIDGPFNSTEWETQVCVLQGSRLVHEKTPLLTP